VPSRSNKSRDAVRGAAKPSDADLQAGSRRPAGRKVTTLHDPAAMQDLSRDRVVTSQRKVPQPADPPSAGSAGNRTHSRLLKNWRVRSRLVLLIAIPTATAVVLGALSIVSSWRSAVSYQRVASLASLSAKITRLAYDLEYERDNTVWFIAMKTNGASGISNTHLSAQALSQLHNVRQLYKYTDQAIGPVLAGVAGIGSSYPPGVVLGAHSVRTELSFIPSVRAAALTPQTSPIEVITSYKLMIDDLLAFEDQIPLSSNDPQLTSTVSALGQISRFEVEYSVQRALIAYALTVGKFAPNMFDMLQASVAQQNADQTQFENFASSTQEELFKVALATGSLKDRVDASESSVIQYALAQPAHSSVATSLASIGILPQEWFGNVTETIGKVRSVEEALASQAVSRAQALRKNAIVNAAAIGGAVLLVLIISLLFTTFVGRSMVRPLRRLRAGALEVAGVRLPETVRRMSESDSESHPIDVQPIDVDSSDEIGEVARAFDQVHREALRLAANEAALRGNVNAMFVNLSRRSQSLVERQIKLIDELEQGEQEPERLASLFQMDHLATRMRRNSENLLVLAGHESTRRWNQPVPLVDVLRAAVSEIQQYERVTLNVQPGIAVSGAAVNDVVHLIAELAENATSFSSADTPVNVSGHLLSSGGVLLDITDQGVGMGGEEMAHANWRLDNPPVVDVAVSRRMGLFVVARLAARHGIRVRLRPATGAGLTALVWLPDEVVVREGVIRPGGLGRFPEPLARFAIGTGTADVAGPESAGSGEFAGAPGSGPVIPSPSGAGSPVSPADWPAASTAEQEVAAARTPRFEPPQDGEESSALGPDSAIPADPVPVFSEDHPVLSQPLGNEWSTPAGPGISEPPVQPAAWGSEQTAEATAAIPAAGDEVSQPAAGWAGDGAEGPLEAGPVPGLRASGSSFRAEDSAYASGNGGVIVPPAASLAQENRLPIFEAVESDWFRRGRPSVDVSGTPSPRASAPSWSSPADEGWRVAEAAVAPSSGGTTMAGLPRRVPKANLIPGTATETTTPAPVRSAAATRERFASLQRGVREARAASGAEKGDGAGDVPDDG
jgi:signal transduction histidine kinase